MPWSSSLPLQRPCSPSPGFSSLWQLYPRGDGSSVPSHPSLSSPQLWGGFGAGGKHMDLTPLLVHHPATTPVTVCAAAPCQHPGVSEPGTGGCLGGCWGALGSVWGGSFSQERMWLHRAPGVAEQGMEP